VKGEGNQRATSVHDTQVEATQRTQKIARRERSDLLVHGAMAKSGRATPSRMTPSHRRVEQASLPKWIKPELAALVKTAPGLHEIKFDGYRMHARLHRSATQSGALQ